MITIARALTPVRNALLSKAEQDAAGVLAGADSSVAQTMAAAQAKAKEILEEARERGEADARHLLAGERAAARGTARERELQAQRQVYDRFRQRVHASLGDLRDSGPLRAALTAQALTVLGPTTVTHDHPSGGVIARTPGRYLDYSLVALADQAFDRLAPDLRELWSP